MAELQRLNSEQDMELMMEFRQTNWDLWCEFCAEHGYEPTVED